MAVDINFPGNLAQVDDAADLRRVSTFLLADGFLYLVSDLGRAYVYDAGASGADDGLNIIRPADKGPLQYGRWVYEVNGIAPGPAGPPGTAGNVADTLAQLKAASISNRTMIFNGATFTWTTGDYTGKVDDVINVKSDSQPVTAGAWVRRPDERRSVRFFPGVTGAGTNQATPLALAYANPQVASPYFPQGDYYIASDLVLTKPTYFDNGAIIRIGSGATLTVAADIIAGQHQIFDVEAGGNIVIQDGAVERITPDWFGANVWYGGSNVVIGKFAGTKLTGADAPTERNYATIVGYRAGQNLTKTNETALFGTFAGAALTDGLFQTGLGYAALRGKETFEGSGVFRQIDGDTNTAIGCATLQDGISLIRNTAVGAFAGKEYETAIDNTLLGTFAGRVSRFGEKNVVIGCNAGYYQGATGIGADTQLNVSVGYAALGNPANKQGSYNTAIGGLSGYTTTTGQMNTFVGYNSGPLADVNGDLSNSLLVGHNARATVSNAVVLAVGVVATRPAVYLGSGEQEAIIAGPGKMELGDSSPVYIQKGTGVPEGVVSAPIGSIYMRLDGGAGTTFYVKETGGTGNTGWVGK